MSAKKRAERNVSQLENRPLAEGRDVSNLPQIMPDIPGMTVLKFWHTVWQFNERDEGQVPSAQTARRPRKPNRAGAASDFGGASPNHQRRSPGVVGTFANRGTNSGQTGHIKN